MKDTEQSKNRECVTGTENSKKGCVKIAEYGIALKSQNAAKLQGAWKTHTMKDKQIAFKMQTKIVRFVYYYLYKLLMLIGLVEIYDNILL